MRISKLVKGFMTRNPAVRECLLRGIVNYNALSRSICEEHQIGQSQAVSIACRRFASRIRNRPPTSEQKRAVNLATVKVDSDLFLATAIGSRTYTFASELDFSIRMRGGIIFGVHDESRAIIVAPNTHFNEISKLLTLEPVSRNVSHLRLRWHTRNHLAQLIALLQIIYEEGCRAHSAVFCGEALNLIVEAEDAENVVRHLTAA